MPYTRRSVCSLASLPPLSPDVLNAAATERSLLSHTMSVPTSSSNHSARPIRRRLQFLSLSVDSNQRHSIELSATALERSLIAAASLETDSNGHAHRGGRPPTLSLAATRVAFTTILHDGSYVQKSISNKLIFPPNMEEYSFTANDLTDLGFIGEGMYGKVNKMRFERTGQIIAVKRVRIISNRGDDYETNISLRQVKNEINAIRSASQCPQIVQFHGATFNEGDCWVCMELMDASLQQIYIAVHAVMKWEFFDENVLGGIAISTIQALDHLKTDQNIIHRDVKPSNILLNCYGQIKVCDFGISGYLVNSVASSKDVGCRPYMAPERLGGNAYDVRSDVWSLGITMVEVCTGNFPYGNILALPLFSQLELVVNGDAPILRDPAYSSRTINFINNCLVKDVDRRPNLRQLRQTEYFLHYANLPELQAHVANFVTNVIPNISTS